MLSGLETTTELQQRFSSLSPAPIELSGLCLFCLRGPWPKQIPPHHVPAGLSQFCHRGVGELGPVGNATQALCRSCFCRFRAADGSSGPVPVPAQPLEKALIFGVVFALL